MEEKVKLVINTLKKSDTPLKTGEISDLCKLPKSEVTRIISKLKKENKIESPKRCFYKVK